ncbi:PKD domain-containing protein, partial [Arenibacter sp. F26102]|uniref:PKD domain-containing protein n=1 Tax=Arenibacter sp. F26102 TaxID=2926416 RepID=UPI001FF0E802
KGGTLGTGNYTAPAPAPGGFPHYLRLVRSGNTLTAYVSETNGSWVQVGSTSIPMGQSIFVGLATTSHNDGVLASAVYENVQVIGNVEENEAPTAVATATPLNGTAPLQVSFTGSGSSDQETPDALAYAWDFGNGDSSSATNPVYTYTTVGSFTATLTVTDPEGLQDTATVTITVDEEVVVDCTPVPSPWTNSDIGNVAANGEACFDNGRFEVKASGADIYNSADEFHYVYQELEGDGEIIAQLISLEQTNDWAKAGVMMRSDLDANSAMAMMIMAPNPNSVGGPGYSFQHRPSKGANMSSGNYTAPAPAPGGFPHYVRLVRSGNAFTAYVSETNGSWVQVGSTNIPMGQNIFVGLATTSHNDGVLASAVYENVQVIGNVEENEAPTAVATATPLNGTAPLQVNFTGSGSSDPENPNGLVYAWDFGNGDTSSATNPVYTYTTVGSFTATLTVTDPEGLQDTATVTITVDEEVVVDCTPVPSPWTNSDIGNVAANGEACFDNGRFEVNASGADIFGSADEFHYVYQELQG